MSQLQELPAVEANQCGGSSVCDDPCSGFRKLAHQERCRSQWKAGQFCIGYGAQVNVINKEVYKSIVSTKVEKSTVVAKLCDGSFLEFLGEGVDR
uniref:Uncharacterized protein n=1 Tax=Ditylenchus dipsaci TaxID=166011 RepID=A0A915DRP8_9BILA